MILEIKISYEELNHDDLKKEYSLWRLKEGGIIIQAEDENVKIKYCSIDTISGTYFNDTVNPVIMIEKSVNRIMKRNNNELLNSILEQHRGKIKMNSLNLL